MKQRLKKKQKLKLLKSWKGQFSILGPSNVDKIMLILMQVSQHIWSPTVSYKWFGFIHREALCWSLWHTYFLFHYLLIDRFKCHTLGLNWIFIWLKASPVSCTTSFFPCRIDSRDGICAHPHLCCLVYNSHQNVFSQPLWRRVKLKVSPGGWWWNTNSGEWLFPSEPKHPAVQPHAINKVRATRRPDARLCCFFISNPERCRLGFGTATPPHLPPCQANWCPR